jgi:hypothetical protein
LPSFACTRARAHARARTRAGVNFFVNMAEAEVVPKKDSEEERIFALLDIVFTAIFAFELCWNISVSTYHEFWFNGWNVFDFIVVCFSIMCVCVCVRARVVV